MLVGNIYSEFTHLRLGPESSIENKQMDRWGKILEKWSIVGK